MADHFEQGGERLRAVGWLLQAAEAAGDGGNVEATLSLVERGLACGPSDADRGQLRLAQMRGLGLRTDWRRVAEAGREVMGLLPVGSVRWFIAAAWVFDAGLFVGDHRQTAPVLQAILDVSVQPEPSGPYASALFHVFVGLAMMNKFGLARIFLARADAVGDTVSDPDPVFVVRLEVARGYLDLANGHLARGLAVLSQARTLALRTGDGWSRVSVPTFATFAFSQSGDRDRALASAREVTEFAEATFWIDWSVFFAAHTGAIANAAQHGPEAIASLRALLDRPDQVLASHARSGLALALANTGDLDGAEREARALLDNRFALPVVRTEAYAALAVAALRRGQPADALAQAEHGLDDSMSDVRWLTTGSILHLARAEALHALGRSADAQVAIREARDRIHAVAATLEDAALRESYVSRVDANARTIELAREWLGEAGT